ncbi:nanos RNA binding domain protein [Oesophagostomum dentatum]|uniref:Nanos RNA binding domain protein n=1 Tax=Oesophagostomum dentatum TaxID=61180 RepID=A0A0B1SJK3_OESDE|nr:nanos RNA binding domain protein [Oesophagostomum dentatum]
MYLQRRRHPMCRYCYECYVHMCMASNKPIPGVHDRGMWHGHNMRERGLVTCPHLWSTVCKHCGATGQFAHTEDYCPLVRSNHRYKHLYPNNRIF